MALAMRVAVFGFLSWLIPFAVSFLAFPLKRLNANLFETLMSLVVVLTAGLLLRLYFRKRPAPGWEAVGVAGVWVVCNLLFDYPMFAYGPMRMTAARYYAEIGLDYLIYPAVALAAVGVRPRQPSQPASPLVRM